MSQRSKTASLYLLAFAVDLANMFIFNAALPAIQHELNTSVIEVAWIGTLYTLGLTISIPVGSWLAHRLGERRTFLASLIVVTIAGVVGALASSVPVVLASRLFQGVGGGLLVPVGQAIAYRAYPPKERAHLTSVVMMVALLVPALSPAISGIAVDHADWRWLFVGVSVLTFGIAALTLTWMPADTPRDDYRPFDLIGFLLSALALFALPAGLSLIADGGSRTGGVAMLTIAAAAGTAYVNFALRSRFPLLDLRLLSDEMLRIGSIIYLCVPGVFTGVNLVAALYLQNELGLSATETGTMMLPWAVASFFAILTTRRIFPVSGARGLFLAGVIVESAGILMLASPYVDLAIGRLASFTAMGFGASLCTSAAQTAAFISIPSARLGEASAIWNINRQMSFSLGASLLGNLLGLLMATDLGSDGTTPYRVCFLLAATLTLIPLPIVLRLRASPHAIND